MDASIRSASSFFSILYKINHVFVFTFYLFFLNLKNIYSFKSGFKIIDLFISAGSSLIILFKTFSPPSNAFLSVINSYKTHPVDLYYKIHPNIIFLLFRNINFKTYQTSALLVYGLFAAIWGLMYESVPTKPKLCGWPLNVSNCLAEPKSPIFKILPLMKMFLVKNFFFIIISTEKI